MFRILGNAIKFVNSIEKILLYLRRIGNSIGILAFGAVKPTNGGYQTQLVTKRLVISKRVIYILMFSVLSVFRKDYGAIDLDIHVPFLFQKTRKSHFL